MAEKACHVVASTAQVGLIQALGGQSNMIASLLRAFLVFGLVGPLIGLICVALQDPKSPAFTPSLLLGLALFAYTMGLVPALAAGLFAWTMRYRLPRYLGGLGCGAIGALTAAFLLTPTPYNAESLRDAFQLGIMPGGAAGLVCGLLYFWPPNNSFKPNLLRKSA